MSFLLSRANKQKDKAFSKKPSIKPTSPYLTVQRMHLHAALSIVQRMLVVVLSLLMFVFLLVRFFHQFVFLSFCYMFVTIYAYYFNVLIYIYVASLLCFAVIKFIRFLLKRFPDSKIFSRFK
jgi:hypothetical protein